MADMMDTIKGLLGDDADNKLKGIMEIINPESQAVTTDTAPPPNEIPPEAMAFLQSAMGQIKNGGDDRTKLLMSLKPYMGKARQDTIDNAVKMLNMSQLSQFFKGVI